MKLNYINKIKANISIYSNKKTSNILDGTYKSVYKGKSMNFENLREYVIGDDVKDIDWKSSARSGTLYIKQFIAEKKHNIMFVMDTGIKMDADTDLYESKKNIALYTAGTIGYIAIKNNDYVGMVIDTNEEIMYKPFKYNLYNLEEYLCEYDKYALEKETNINDLLEYVYKNITKKMIIFVITDMNGVEKIKTNTLKKLMQNNDVLVININDNYMFGDNIYDVNNNKYIPEFLLNDKKLHEVEMEVRKDILKKNMRKLKRNSVSTTSISSVKEINNKIIKLLEEHKYAGTN
ncbi:MAG: DUF58 domain-containing protein [Bacilli bacterium]|nr:DUF58 domain-containing protein [Bacilli bacterium]